MCIRDRGAPPPASQHGPQDDPTPAVAPADGRPPPPPPPQQPPLPPGWTQHWSEDQKAHFWHFAAANHSTW
eukprot:5712698-Alexandrium_andersonii.AAC.1